MRFRTRYTHAHAHAHHAHLRCTPVLSHRHTHNIHTHRHRQRCQKIGQEHQGTTRRPSLPMPTQGDHELGWLPESHPCRGCHPIPVAVFPCPSSRSRYPPMNTLSDRMYIRFHTMSSAGHHMSHTFPASPLTHSRIFPPSHHPSHIF